MDKTAETTPSTPARCLRTDREILLECHQLLSAVNRSLKLLVRYLPKTMRSGRMKTTLSGTRLLQFEKATALRRHHPDWPLFRVCRKAIASADGPDGYDNPSSLQRYMFVHGIK